MATDRPLKARRGAARRSLADTMAAVRPRRSAPSPVSRPRQVANVVAAVFLVALAASVVMVAWQVLYPDYEDYDMDILLRDLEAFAGPVDGSPSLIDGQPCAGEGLFPAAAQRRYGLPGTVAAVTESIKAEASSLGWSAVPPPEELAPAPERFGFEKGDRALFVALGLTDPGRVEVELAVTGGDPC